MEFLKKNADALKKAGVKELDPEKLDKQKMDEMAKTVKKFEEGQKSNKSVSRGEAAEAAKDKALD